MKILLDQGTPAPLRRYLKTHEIHTCYERGWSELSNGELLDSAEENGYALLITTDQNLKNQQNLAERKLAVMVLLSTSWRMIRHRIGDIQMAVDEIEVGDYKEISM